MNKPLMERLYEQVGEDVSRIGHSQYYPRVHFIVYNPKALNNLYDVPYCFAEKDSDAYNERDGYKLVCSLEEYKDFCKTKQQPIDEEVIYTIDLSHPLARNVKVYDFIDNEITKVVKVEWTKDETYVTILSENATLGDKDNVAHFRGRVKGAKVVIQQRGE